MSWNYLGQRKASNIHWIGNWILSRFMLKFFINKIYHNSRKKYHIGRKFRPREKLSKRNTKLSKKIDNDVTAKTCNTLFLFERFPSAVLFSSITFNKNVPFTFRKPFSYSLWKPNLDCGRFISAFSCKFLQVCVTLQRIWSHLLKKFLMENFICCAVL